MTNLIILGVLFLFFWIIYKIGAEDSKVAQEAQRKQEKQQQAQKASEHEVNISLQEMMLLLPEPMRTETWQLLCLLHDHQYTPDAHTRSLVQQVQNDYLHETLKAYLALTPIAKQQLLSQGKPAEHLLQEQIHLMQKGITEALQHDHVLADQLLTQGRFLRDRFHSNELRI